MRIESFLAKCFLSIITIIVLFAVLEFISPYILPFAPTKIDSIWDSPMFRYPYPFIVFKGKAFARGLNEFGYSGKPAYVDKQPGTYRVFMLGGSTVFNQITEPLESLFKRNGFDNVEVYNYGVVSSVSGMALARLVFEILDRSPDIVIMYNGGNDIMDGYMEQTRPGYPFNYVVYEHNPLLYHNLDKYNWLMLLLYRSNLFRYALRNRYVKLYLTPHTDDRAPPWMSEEWKEAVAMNYVNNIIKAHKISAAFSSDMVTFLQPLIYFKNELVGPETSIEPNTSEVRDYVYEMREKITSKANVAREIDGVNFVDLSNTFKANKDIIFKDFIHIEPEANLIIARAIYDVIMPRVKASLIKQEEK
ncbi:MAG: hypothetical protein JW938_04220 [Candidatus Omnitrophica bacterium]|nr:hypothetical protein [Candidatus Omnitrophota bacterium]